MAAMTPATQRKVQRLVHLAAAIVLVGYIYTPIGGHLQDVARLVVFPLLAVTGIAMWQAARIRRTLRARRGRGKVRTRAGLPDPDAPASQTAAR
jgi:thiosulfate reductase cytochrome b subunit